MAFSSFIASIEDPTNQFYLHHGDSPDLLLVSQHLIGENCHTWNRSMKMALTAKNKIGFIDSTLTKPSDSSNPLNHAWIRYNNMVLSLILNSVSKEIEASVIYINTAEEMWIDLKKRFCQQNDPLVFQLQKAISFLYQETEYLLYFP